MSRRFVEVQVGDDRALGVRGGGQDQAPRIDDQRAPTGAQAAGVVADLVGGDDEALVLDRPRAHQHLPVIARGRQRERGGHRDQLGAAQGEDPVELGEAQVVADAHAQLQAVGELGHHDLVAGILGGGLGVHGTVDLDVEQVDLAVDRLDLPVGPDVDAGVEALLGVLDVLEQRAGDQVDAELGGGAARPRDRRAVQGLGPGGHVLARAEHGPLLGQDDELGAARGGLADEPVGPFQVTIGVLGGVELDGGCAHGDPPDGRGTD